jgi:hypothetical protein
MFLSAVVWIASLSGISWLWEIVALLWLAGCVSGVLFSVTHAAREARIRRRYGKCFVCGYDMTGIDTRCPECGREQGVKA